MLDSSVPKLQIFFTRLVPVVFFFLAILVDRASILDFLPVHPLLSFSIIYYWSLYRPDWISIAGLIGAGILDDSLSGAYIGQNTLVFLLIYAVVLKKMDYFISATFLRTWGAFALIMTACGCIQWFFSIFLYPQPIHFIILLLQNAATVLMFPVVYGLLNRIATYTYEWE